MKAENKDMRQVPVMILGSNTAGLGAIRGFGMIGVPVYVVNYGRDQYVNMGSSSRYVCDSIQAPDPLQENAFIEVLLHKSKQWRGALIVPSSDDTLVVVSKYKKLLEQNGYIVVSNEWDKTRRVIEKNNTYRLAEDIGVLVPKTYRPRSVQEHYLQHGK